MSKNADSILLSVGTSADTSVQSLAQVALSKQHILHGRREGGLRWCPIVKGELAWLLNESRV